MPVAWDHDQPTVVELPEAAGKALGEHGYVLDPPGQVALVQDLGVQLADQIGDPRPGQRGPVRHPGDQAEPVPVKRGPHGGERFRADPGDPVDDAADDARVLGRVVPAEPALAELLLELGEGERFRRAQRGDGRHQRHGAVRAAVGPGLGHRLDVGHMDAVAVERAEQAEASPGQADVLGGGHDQQASGHDVTSEQGAEEVSDGLSLAPVYMAFSTSIRASGVVIPARLPDDRRCL